jgi:hypothetical protein
VSQVVLSHIMGGCFGKATSGVEPAVPTRVVIVQTTVKKEEEGRDYLECTHQEATYQASPSQSPHTSPSRRVGLGVKILLPPLRAHSPLARRVLERNLSHSNSLSWALARALSQSPSQSASHSLPPSIPPLMILTSQAEQTQT